MSDVELIDCAGGEPRAVVSAHGGERCERCWKRYAQLAAEPADVCDRCACVLREAPPRGC